MALAITPFTGLCGFIPLDQIAVHLRSSPEFASLIPKAISETFLSISSSSNSEGPKEKAALRDVFSALMTADETLVKEQLVVLTKRLAGGDVRDGEKDLKDLILRINQQFPGDVGVFCPFMLNYVKLSPGEAMFLGAGEPHAYVSGGMYESHTFDIYISTSLDMMECMANSDNVIRAGLTPKLRDIPNLISGLTYSASLPSKHVVNATPFGKAGKSTTLYDPPVPEFSVLQVKIGAGEAESHAAIDGPSIAIVTEGNGTLGWGNNDPLQLSKGQVIFIGQGTDIKIQAGDEALTVFRAFCSSD